MPASIHSSSGSTTTASTTTTSTTTSHWRKCGQRLRAALIDQDDAQQQFCLSDDCPIERYYKVADKVLDQFLNHPIDTRDELLEAYMVGHRLVQFLSQILPTHGAYFGAAAKRQRDRSQEQLVQVLRYLDQMAVLIDKQEHEEYIRSVLGSEEEEENRRASLNKHSSIQNNRVDTSMTSLLQGTATVPEPVHHNTRGMTPSKSSSSRKPPSPTKSSLRSSSGDHRSNNVWWQKQPEPQQPPPPQHHARSLPSLSSSSAPSHPNQQQQRSRNQHYTRSQLQQTSVDESGSRRNRPVRQEQEHEDADLLNQSQESTVRAIAKNWPPQRNEATMTAPSPRHAEPTHRQQRQERQHPEPKKTGSIYLQFQPTRDVLRHQPTVERSSQHTQSQVKVSAEHRDPRPTTRHPPVAATYAEHGHHMQSQVTVSAEQGGPTPTTTGQPFIVATDDTENSHHSQSHGKVSTEQRGPRPTKSQPVVAAAEKGRPAMSTIDPGAGPSSNERGNPTETNQNVNERKDARPSENGRKTSISVEFPSANTRNGVSSESHLDEPLIQNTTAAATSTWEEAYARNLPDSIGCSASEDENEKDDAAAELVPNDEISVSSSAFQREESVASSQRTSIAGRKAEIREQFPVVSKSEDEAWASFSTSQQHEEAPGPMRELSLSNASSELSFTPCKGASRLQTVPIVSINTSCGSEASAQQLIKQDIYFPSSPIMVENMISHDSSSTGQYFLPYEKLASRNSFEKEEVSFDSVDFEQSTSHGAHSPPVVTPTEGKRNLRQTVSEGDEQLVRAHAIARREGALSRFRQSQPSVNGAVTSLEPPRVVSPETKVPAPCSDVALDAGYSASALDWSRIDEHSVMSRNSHQTMQTKVMGVAAPAPHAAENLDDTSGGDFYFSSQSPQVGEKKFSTLVSPIRSNNLSLGLVTDPEPGSWQQTWVSSPNSHRSAANPNSFEMPLLPDRVIRPRVSHGDTEIEGHARPELNVKSKQNNPKASSATLSSFNYNTKKPSPIVKSSLNLKSTDTTTTRSTSTIGSHFSESRTAPIGPVTEMDSKWDDLKLAYYRGSADDDALFLREPKPCLLICGRKNMEKERSPNEHLDMDDESSLQLLKPNRRSHFRSCVRFLLD